MIVIHQIKLPIGHTQEDLQKSIQKVLHIQKPIRKYNIIKQSIDARDKENLKYIYSIEVSCQDEMKLVKRLDNNNIMLSNRTVYSISNFLNNQTSTILQLHHRPVIIGSGPAGLFCGYALAQAGYQPIIIERGQKIEERILTVDHYWKTNELNANCNVQFGEGGAGTFSDGKLNTMIKDKTGRIRYVLETFVKHGAPDEITYLNKPHIGTDRLRNIIISLRKEIEQLGGSVYFEHQLTELQIIENKLNGIRIQTPSGEETLPCDCLVLAIGHSARDTFEMLYKQNITLTSKAFAMGLRIEHPASMIHISQYGNSTEAQTLSNADYKLTYQADNGRSVYSFCMCPGGYVVDASSESEQIAVNGMSNYARDAQNSNSAIVVNVTPEDYEDDSPLAGMNYQRKWERAAYQAGKGCVPVQRLEDYIANQKSSNIGMVVPSLKGNYTLSNLNDCLPNYINSAIIEGIMSFDSKIKGFASPDAIVSGIESRTSSPIRINRDNNYCSNIAGIYPCGEGAGYAGGITSAAVDGLRIAEAIITKYQPIKERER